MSEIKALEKMRKYVSEWWAPDEAVNEDVNRFADEIQAEVDERFMELPVDADGVPIRVGDTVEWLVKNGDYEVVAVGELVALKLGEDGSFTIAADALRHVKPRTLEDVLCDFVNDVAKQGHQIGLTAHGLSDKYAADIRELLGVDA